MTSTAILNNEYRLSNYFFIDMQTQQPIESDDRTGAMTYFTDNWVNPYSRSTIKPYVPSDSQELVKICADAYTKYLKEPNFDTTGALFYELKEPFVVIFSNLDPKSLANFSEVSKCCYLAIKPPIIWELQMNKLLPNVKILPTELCQFSCEQQFKIIFKRVHDELKPYISKLKRNNEVLNELRGSNGMNGTIDAAWKDLEKKGGVKRASGLRYVIFLSEEEKTTLIAYQKYYALNQQRVRLAGEGYNGTVGSIGPDSQQYRLQEAIDSGVRNAYNDQDQFEKIIQTSEAQTNTLNLMADSLEDVKNGIGDFFKKDSNPPDSSCG